MHDCYETLSRAAMRAEVEFIPAGRASSLTSQWRARMMLAIDNGVHPLVMRACGVTAELLAYCGITLEHLVERKTHYGRSIVSTLDRPRYPLEHMIEAFDFSFDDLCMLGFSLPMLALKHLYPLIALYDLCEFRAATLFRLEIGYSDVQNFIINVDPRYTQLLQLNLPWWQRALAPPTIRALNVH